MANIIFQPKGVIMSQERKIIKTEELIRFLSIGRPIGEISSNFGIELSAVERELKEMENLDGYDLFQQRNERNEKIFMLIPEIPKPELKPRIWQFRKHPHRPYLWIQLPDLPYKKIKIIPLSDIHYGEKGHKAELFKRYIDWGVRTKNAFFFLNGDLTANALGDSPGTSIFGQIMSPREQRIRLAEELRPIAHKILWSDPGGHEFRSVARVDFDPSEWICRELDIPYFSTPVYVDVLWKGYRFPFYCMHGRRTPGTPGGRLNKASAPLKMQEFVQFVICGHFHDAQINKVTRICRERDFDKSGKLSSFRLSEKKQYVVVCPSFYDFFGTYAEGAGFSPGSWGNVTCELYPNGDYHATR